MNLSFFKKENKHIKQTNKQQIEFKLEFDFPVKSVSGKRVFLSALKVKGWPTLERQEVRMLAQVTTNASEILARRKTKVSFAMKISEGLVGPKGMAKAAPDGHTVNIP